MIRFISVWAAFYGIHLQTTLTLHNSLVFTSLPAMTLELFCIMLVRGEAASSMCSDKSDSFGSAGSWEPELPKCKLKKEPFLNWISIETFY